MEKELYLIQMEQQLMMVIGEMEYLMEKVYINEKMDNMKKLSLLMDLTFNIYKLNIIRQNKISLSKYLLSKI